MFKRLTIKRTNKEDYPPNHYNYRLLSLHTAYHKHLHLDVHTAFRKSSESWSISETEVA